MMHKRIFRSIFTVATAVLLACMIIILGVLYEYFTAMQRDMLRTQTELAAHAVENEGIAYFDGLDAAGYRFTLVAADGTVLYDNEADAGTMENHADREEIQEALSSGSGESERISATMAEKTIYMAKRLVNGTVLRVSVNQYTVLTLLLGMAQPFFIVLLLAVVLAAVIAGQLSKKIVGELNDVDLDKPLENDVYDELAPMLGKIERQQRELKNRADELCRRQDEFTAVTDNMTEALILLGENGEILSINKAALTLFAADDSCRGENILTVDRSADMQKLVQAAMSGSRGEYEKKEADKVYQINAAPVVSAAKTAGVCIIAFDITQKTMAEQQRREFTANVSHELKTPLQAIMGAAELIENGLARPEDTARFAGDIHASAQRLLALINDIIRLSQLDEGAAMPYEKVSLTQTAAEAAEALRGEADSRGVSIELSGDDVTVDGVRQLLYEIVFNLVDNAVKYNHRGGSVKINVAAEGDGAVLSVTDDGIGIPSEAQDRVFERFYRADKSRSRENGGTGLGLSIVKHAAACHNARVSLISEPGKGTTMKICFPPVK